MRNKRGRLYKLDRKGFFGTRFILLHPMVKWLHKLLFVAISFSFFISATELDLGEAHNTFFDDYDTYIKTEQISVDHSDVIQQQQQELYEFVSFLCSVHNNFFAEKKLSQRIKYTTYNASPPKLFLRNSVWRI